MSDDIEEHQVALDLIRRETAADSAGTSQQHFVAVNTAFRAAVDRNKSAIGTIVDQGETLAPALNASVLT